MDVVSVSSTMMRWRPMKPVEARRMISPVSWSALEPWIQTTLSVTWPSRVKRACAWLSAGASTVTLLGSCAIRRSSVSSV